MKDFLTYLLEQIVDFPKEVSIEETVDENNIYLYKIKLNQQDMGKVIGKDGKIIQAIRTVSKIIAIKQSKQIRIELS